MTPRAGIGIIGGTGIQDLPDLEIVEEVELETPFGAPSGPYLVGRLEGRSLAFLARHGPGHRLSPSEINFRANLYGFKKLGVERIFSASAVGSLQEDVHPLDVVIPDQFFDATRQRSRSFFEEGVVVHVGFSDPLCPSLRGVLLKAAREESISHHDGGTYLCIEGPQFSTRAESMVYRSWGARVIGMTNLPEAKLAREAEICYATLALVTDYDCWKVDEEPVTVDQVLDHLRRNAASARRLLRAALVDAALDADDGCGCRNALDTAVLTARSAIPDPARRRLELLLRRYLETPPA
jgi:5'-methylthioadenosine phosphorylase